MFQFTHPVWGATIANRQLTASKMFQFTHPVWGATNSQSLVHLVGCVSIHAPRVGCDTVMI